MIACVRPEDVQLQNRNKIYLVCDLTILNTECPFLKTCLVSNTSLGGHRAEDELDIHSDYFFQLAYFMENEWMSPK